MQVFLEGEFSKEPISADCLSAESSPVLSYKDDEMSLEDVQMVQGTCSLEDCKLGFKE